MEKFDELKKFIGCFIGLRVLKLVRQKLDKSGMDFWGPERQKD